LHILITAANSAAAYQLKNTLNIPDVILGDYMELPDLMLKTGRMIKLPNPVLSTYTHEMLKLCLDLDIGTVYILRKEEEEPLLGAKQLFNEYNITLIIPGNEI